MAEIAVIDPNGHEATVYEREIRERLPATERHRKLVFYELSSGERVQPIDEDTFMLNTTGGKYVRIRE